MQNRAIGVSFLKEKGLIQRRKRTDRWVRARRGRLTHCTGQAQSWQVNCSKKTLSSNGESARAYPMPLEYVPPTASLATFLFVEQSSRLMLDMAAVPNGLLQMI